MPDGILVTGAGGYLGRRLTTALAGSTPEVLAVFRTPPTIPAAAPAVSLTCRLDDRDSVAQLIARHRPRAIIHAAAWIPGGASDPDGLGRAIGDNIAATINLVEAAARAGAGRLVFCSSVEVYGPAPASGAAHREADPLAPSSAYGRSKLAAEMAVRLLEGTATKPVIARMPGIHGHPRTAGFIGTVIRNAISGAAISVPEPDTRLSVLMLDDASAALTALATAEADRCPTVVNLASGEIGLLELAQRIVALAGGKSTIAMGSRPARNRVLDVSLAMHLGLLRAGTLDESLAREIGLHRAR